MKNRFQTPPIFDNPSPHFFYLHQTSRSILTMPLCKSAALRSNKATAEATFQTEIRFERELYSNRQQAHLTRRGEVLFIARSSQKTVSLTGTKSTSSRLLFHKGYPTKQSSSSMFLIRQREAGRYNLLLKNATNCGFHPDLRSTPNQLLFHKGYPPTSPSVCYFTRQRDGVGSFCMLRKRHKKRVFLRSLKPLQS